MSGLQPWQGALAGDCLRLAFNFAPASQRQRWLAAAALRDAVLASANVSQEAAVCQTQLAWWQEELLRMVRGEPRHPLARQFADSGIAAGEDSAQLLREWPIVASRWIRDEPPESENQWRIQAFRIHGTTLLLSLDDAVEREPLTPGFRDCAVALAMLDLPREARPSGTLGHDSIEAAMQALATHTDDSDHVALAVLAGLCHQALAQQHGRSAPQGPLRRLLSAWRMARASRRKQPRRTRQP